MTVLVDQSISIFDGGSEDNWLVIEVVDEDLRRNQVFEKSKVKGESAAASRKQ